MIFPPFRILHLAVMICQRCPDYLTPQGMASLHFRILHLATMTYLHSLDCLIPESMIFLPFQILP
jgi:hypothetical protein